MIFDPSSQFYTINDFIIYFLSDTANLFFCFIFLTIFLLLQKINIKEFFYWSLLFCFVSIINILAVSFNIFPDLNGYLVCLRDLRDNLSFQELECTITSMGSSDTELTEDGGAIGVFSLKRSLPAILYSLVPIPSIATLSSLGFINKIFLFLTYLALKKHITHIKPHLKILLFLFILPSIIIYSSIGLRDNIIFCTQALLLLTIFQKEFIKSSFLLAILYAIKLQNALIFSILFVGVFIFKADQSKRLFMFFCLSILGIIVYFQERIVEIINYFRLAFLNEVGALSPNMVFDGYDSLFQIILMSPLIFTKGLLAPLPLNALSAIFFIESISIVVISIWIISKQLFSNSLFFMLVCITIFSGVVLNALVIENDFTFLRYKYSFTFLFVIYLLIDSKRNTKNS
jgi:hypothetical protein